MEEVHHSVKEFIEEAEYEEKKKTRNRHEMLLLISLATFVFGVIMGSTRITGFAISQPVAAFIMPASMILIILALIFLWLDLKKK